MMMSPTELSRLGFTPGARMTLRKELEIMRAHHFTWKVMRALGMADRLKTVAGMM